jgi:fido (protein-threonine AMPylation protein)
VFKTDTDYVLQSKGGNSSIYWKTAIGLQQVDGLTPSEYLIELADSEIKNEISLDRAEDFINSYYKNKEEKSENRQEEADKVSLRIVRALSDRTFKLSPATLQSIHRQLFSELLENAGDFRDYNISKNEWVLDGKSVIYDDFRTIEQSLNYDFEKEKNFNFSKLNEKQIINHIVKFTSDLWQIHPFAEGNTRTTAVFTIKYLRTFGYEVTNDTFEKNSQYFRNALVRANYNDVKNNVFATPIYLERFFENLLFDGENELKNRELKVE